MTFEEAILQVGCLLEQFPGVNLVSAVHRDGNNDTYIRLRITCYQSLARIVNHCTVGANVAVEILPGGRAMHDGQRFDEGNLRFDIRIPDDDGRGSFEDPPAPLHILGYYLVRDLKYLGLVSHDDADNLQRQFHGVVK